MRVEKINYDKGYPYRISDGWGGSICADEEDLIDLKEQIERLLDRKQHIKNIKYIKY